MRGGQFDETREVEALMEATLAGGWLVSDQETNSLWILRAALAPPHQPQ